MATSETKVTAGGPLARAGAAIGAARPVSPSGAGTVAALFGALASTVGLVFAAVGAIGVDVSMEAAGIVLGVVGYALGARALGLITIVLSTLMLIVVVMIGMGELPGLGPTDPLAF